MRLPAAVVLVCLLVASRADASEHHHHHEHHEHHEHKADARKHLENANQLAGEGKCAAAIKEYTAAYDKLQDPIVLFNRAECYRRLGQNADAAADYRGFLRGFPGAPNRAEIEARIAALEKPAPPKPAAVTPRPPAGATPSAQATRTPAGTAPPSARPSAPVAAAPPPAASPPIATAPPPPSPGPMPFLPPPPPAGSDSKTLIEAPRSTPPEASPAEASHGSHWWLWTTLAVVAVGGGVAAYWFLRPKPEPVPTTTLGNFRF
jgi:hypothetical protein